MSELARRGAVWTRERSAGGAGKPRAQARRGRAGQRPGRPDSPAARPLPLRLVADGGRLVPDASGEPAGAGQGPVRTQPRPRAVPERPGPVRLTRRGRIVVTAAAVLAIGAASMALAGAAHAAGHRAGARPGPGSGATKVAIRPGQSLWSVAEAYDPDADTRLVIQQIEQMNSLTGDQVQPGQELWVPRG